MLDSASDEQQYLHQLHPSTNHSITRVIAKAVVFAASHDAAARRPAQCLPAPQARIQQLGMLLLFCMWAFFFRPAKEKCMQAKQQQRS